MKHSQLRAEDTRLPADLDHSLCQMLVDWDAHERNSGSHSVIDFDASHLELTPRPAGRLSVLNSIRHLAEDRRLTPLARQRLAGHEVFLRCLAGECFAFREYVARTVGVSPSLVPERYLQMRQDSVRSRIAKIGFSFDARTKAEMASMDGHLAPSEMAEIMIATYDLQRGELEALVGIKLDFEIEVEVVEESAYWTHWVDGGPDTFRLRINIAKADRGRAASRRLAYHELLGHCAQIVALGNKVSNGSIASYFGLTTVHTLEQFAFEGIAQTLPLALATDEPQDELLLAQLFLDHYTSLVENNLHIMINDGTPLADCLEYSRRWLPFRPEDDAAADIEGRAADPLWRTYQYVYPISFDVFLSSFERANREERLQWTREIYRNPIQIFRPSDNRERWGSGL